MHLSEMLLELCNSLRKAAFFGAIFISVPTYAEINLRTNKISSLPDVNKLFLIRTSLKSTYGDPGGIAAFGLLRLDMLGVNSCACLRYAVPASRVSVLVENHQ